jgi:hypothetical protein
LNDKTVCSLCGLPFREGDKHAEVGEPTETGERFLYCMVTIMTDNPKKIGVISSVVLNENL